MTVLKIIAIICFIVGIGLIGYLGYWFGRAGYYEMPDAENDD